MRDLAVVLARHVHSALQLGDGMTDILYYMSQLFAQKAQGVEWSPDMDMLLTGGIQQEAYAVALATDGLLSLIRALSDLTDKASPAVGVAPPKSRVPTRQELMAEMPVTVRAAMEAAEGELSQVEAEAAAAAMREAELGDTLEMVEATAVRRTVAAMCTALWEITLLPLSMLLANAKGEALVLDLLKGYQSFTETAGVVGEADICDAWLASLCDFTLAQSQPARLLPPDPRRFGVHPDQVPSPQPLTVSRGAPATVSRTTPLKLVSPTMSLSLTVSLTASPGGRHERRSIRTGAHRLIRQRLVGRHWALRLTSAVGRWWRGRGR